jgi:DNA-binding NtrC family response regulator
MYCRLLIVDDDQNILNSLRRELLRPPHIGTEGIEIETFRRPADALARVAEADGSFDAAIVDYRMPGMDGIAFLDQLRELRPETIRILLTGSIDVDGAIAAINAARVDHLLNKPWHEYDLKGRIALALHQRELRQNVAATLPMSPGKSPFQLLLVDDEESLLNALVRELSFRGRATQGPNPLFQIRTAKSAAEALQSIATSVPDLVIADYMMPDGDGIELLHQIRERHPRCVRILLSGRADLSVLQDAINIAGIYHFLGKPWEAAALRAVIAEALTYRNLINAAAPVTRSTS